MGTIEKQKGNLANIENDLALLISRLERLSADSQFAHRASGYRGTLLRYLENIRSEREISLADMDYLQKLIDQAYQILQAAARDISPRFIEIIET
jgi:hypothetical protein